MIAQQVKEKKPHIKKPLNAFMLFMKQKRADVIKECTLKESAAINQILGKMVCGRVWWGGVGASWYVEANSYWIVSLCFAVARIGQE